MPCEKASQALPEPRHPIIRILYWPTLRELLRRQAACQPSKEGPAAHRFMIKGAIAVDLICGEAPCVNFAFLCGSRPGLCVRKASIGEGEFLNENRHADQVSPPKQHF